MPEYALGWAGPAGLHCLAGRPCPAGCRWVTGGTLKRVLGIAYWRAQALLSLTACHHPPGGWCESTGATAPFPSTLASKAQ